VQQSQLTGAVKNLTPLCRLPLTGPKRYTSREQDRTSIRQREEKLTMIALRLVAKENTTHPDKAGTTNY